MTILSISCLEPVSAQSAVYVYAESTGGEFNFEGSGDEWIWDISVEGFDVANTDVTNNWGVTSNVRYENIGEGSIFMKVAHKHAGDEFWYFNWLREDINGDGIYTKGLPGGHSVNVTNSPNVTGFIDYRERDHKAVFLMDSRHTSADLTVIVHNGHLLENATVELLGGPHETAWSDENGVAELSPPGGKYAILVEHEDFNPMLVEELIFENDKHYLIKINMSQCYSSVGSPFCDSSADDLVMFYKQKAPNMGPIQPQEYVDYFSERLTTCMAGRDNEAVGTLEIMSRKWGIFPSDLGVLLFSCDFEKVQCGKTDCEWKIDYVVKNFQKEPHDYIVTLIVGNTTTELNTGTLGPTFSSTAKEAITKTVMVEGCNHEPDCGGQMYLSVVSKKVGE